MTTNIDLSASLRVSTPGDNSKTVGFQSSAADKPYAFRDILKSAVRSRGQSEAKIGWSEEDRSKALKKELVSKSEEKLKSFKKFEINDLENVKPIEKNTNKETDVKDIPIEQILLQLEELGKMQQMGDISADKQTAVLEKIKEVLYSLTSVQTAGMEGIESEILQTKLAELTKVLEGMQEKLKTYGSLTDKDAYEGFFKELKAIVKEASAKVETASNNRAEYNNSEKLNGKADNIEDESTMSNTEAGYKSDKELLVQKTEENDNMTAENSMTNEANRKQKQGIKTGAPITDTKSAAKEAQLESEESTDAVKMALNSKVEKVNISGKESNKQDSEAETNKEASKEVFKAADTIQNKPVNEEITAIKLEQTVTDNKSEAVQNQAAVPKAQIVNKADVINQIVKKAEIIFTDAQPEMRMQLEPENLGKLTLSIAVEKGLITAKFVAESHEVKQIIESNFNELKDMLQEKGLEVQNFSVSVGHEDRGNNNSNAFQQWGETVRLNGRSMMRGSYEGYPEGEGTARAANPYSVHNGKFDHRA